MTNGGSVVGPGGPGRFRATGKMERRPSSVKLDTSDLTGSVSETGYAQSGTEQAALAFEPGRKAANISLMGQGGNPVCLAISESAATTIKEGTLPDRSAEILNQDIKGGKALYKVTYKVEQNKEGGYILKATEVSLKKPAGSKAIKSDIMAIAPDIKLSEEQMQNLVWMSGTKSGRGLVIGDTFSVAISLGSSDEGPVAVTQPIEPHEA